MNIYIKVDNKVKEDTAKNKIVDIKVEEKVENKIKELKDNYNELTVKLNKLMKGKQINYLTTKCSRIHKPIKSSCFTPPTELRHYCENDSVIFKPFPARFYKQSKKDKK